MVKIEKQSQVPDSLKAQTTNKRRDKLIESKAYLNEDKFNNRYKEKDIKDSLVQASNEKCVYCECNLTDRYSHIEHYRPKSLYYWLAYSWDNLLLSCEICNNKKSNKFKIAAQERAAYKENFLKNIHNMGSEYDAQESPYLINPAKEDVESKLTFTMEGKIDSKDNRCQYTISTCDLNRDKLLEKRQKLSGDLMSKLKRRLTELRKGDYDARAKIKGLIEDFKSDTDNAANEFIAFRKYVIKNHLEPLESRINKLLS